MNDFLMMMAQTYSSTGSEEEVAAGFVALFLSLWAGMGLFMIVMYILALLIVLAMFVLRIYLKWKILERTGMTPWLALLAVIPVGDLILEFILAFNDWPDPKRTVAKK